MDSNFPISKMMIENAFKTVVGCEAYSSISHTIRENRMEEMIRSGVAVGFSGGPDSVMLLCYLYIRSLTDDFPLCAIHVNHGIRGEEADRDEEFSRRFCHTLNIPFVAYKRDVPAYAKECGKGTEEAAREVRYSVFDDFISKNPEYGCIATAHNSTDNLETLTFNLLRGSGLAGLCGIPPIRGNIIRPLLSLSKEKIMALLSESDIPYVIDGTNLSTDYTRNYIRHEILPKFKVLNSNSEHSAEKITAILREENEALDAIVSDFLHKSASVGKIRREDFLSLHRGILNRAIIKFVNINTGANLEFVHTQKIKELLYKGSEFRTDIPTGFSFVCDGEYCYTAKKADVESVGEPEYVTERKLILGLNEIEQMGIAISLSKNDNIDFSSNVYKFSIQAKVNFDIIEGNLTVRSKIDGDSYTFGGMRRRLKRLFTDKKIPKDERRRIPVICDDNGILWVPGFSVRDGARAASGQNIIYITVYSKSNTDKESDAQPGV